MSALLVWLMSMRSGDHLPSRDQLAHLPLCHKKHNNMKFCTRNHYTVAVGILLTNRFDVSSTRKWHRSLRSVPFPNKSINRLAKPEAIMASSQNCWISLNWPVADLSATRVHWRKGREAAGTTRVMMMRHNWERSNYWIYAQGQKFRMFRCELVVGRGSKVA